MRKSTNAVGTAAQYPRHRIRKLRAGISYLLLDQKRGNRLEVMGSEGINDILSKIWRILCVF